MYWLSCIQPLCVAVIALSLASIQSESGLDVFCLHVPSQPCSSVLASAVEAQEAILPCWLSTAGLIPGS